MVITLQTMNKSFIFLVYLLSSHSLAGLASVTLYFEPDTEAAVAAHLDPTDRALENAKPVLEAVKQSEGWLWMEYEVSFNGFVKNEEIGKNLTVKPGAIVRLRPDGDSPILTIIEIMDVVELFDVGDWAQIELTKPVPVYLQKSPPTPISAKVSPVAIQPGLIEVPTDTIPSVQGRPVIETTLPAASLHREFVGTLKSHRRHFPLRSKYNLKLVNEKGKRIAFVEHDGLLLSGSLEDFIGKEVIIFGVLEPVKEPKSYLIKASALRLKP